VVERMEVCV